MLIRKMFSAMLSDAFADDDETKMKIRYRTGGKLFNSRRLKAKTKVKEDAVRDLLFADDCALNVATESQMMQRKINNFATSYTNFGLTISINLLHKNNTLNPPSVSEDKL